MKTVSREKGAGLNWLFKEGPSRQVMFEVRYKEYISLLDTL